MATKDSSPTGGDMDQRQGEHPVAASLDASNRPNATQAPQGHRVRGGAGQAGNDAGALVPTGVILAPVAAIKDSVRDLVSSDVASALAGVGVGDALATIGAIESIKRMLEVQQARLTAHVVRERTQARQARKHSARGVVKETARDIGLHRGVTMTLARRLVDAATAVPTQAPKLFSLWRAGDVGEEKVLSFFTDTKLALHS